MRHFATLALLLALALLPGAESAVAPVVAPAPAQSEAPSAQPAPMFTDQEWSATQRDLPSTAAPQAPGVGSAAGLLVGLVVVIGLAVGLGWLVKRLNARRLLGGRGRHLEVLETVTVGARRQLALVRCGSHWLVIGLGERELVAVATLPAPPEAAPASAGAAAAVPAPAPEPAPVPASPFASELGRLLGGRQP